MRTAALTLLCFVAFGYAMNAQRFTLLPQVGFENSKTRISYDDLSSFSPGGVSFSPQASLRLNYSSKKGHGFFAGAATSRSIVSFSFADPKTAMSDYTSITGNMQLRLEGGYLFNTPRIALKKNGGKTASKSVSANAKKSSCSGSYYSSRCASKTKTRTSNPKPPETWIRVQPSAGMAFIPSPRTDVIMKSQAGTASYEYRAGNWQAGVIAGAGVEFGKGNLSKMTVSLNYYRGISNLGEQVITSSEAGKVVATKLSSSASGWNLRVGIPFALTKNKATPSKTKSASETKRIKKAHCQPVRSYRCGW